MIPTWFNTPARVASLRAVAQELEGTPFFPNSEAPGRDGGMDCVRILHYVDYTLGVTDKHRIPDQIMDHGQHSERSLLIEAFETWPWLRAHYRRLPDCDPASLLPGDKLCFLAGKVAHHGGVLLSDNSFLHTLKPAGAHVFPLSSAIRAWRVLGQLTAVYRPLP